MSAGTLHFQVFIDFMKESQGFEICDIDLLSVLELGFSRMTFTQRFSQSMEATNSQYLMGKSEGFLYPP